MAEDILLGIFELYTGTRLDEGLHAHLVSACTTAPVFDPHNLQVQAEKKSYDTFISRLQ